MAVRLKTPTSEVGPVTQVVGGRKVCSSRSVCDWSGLAQRICAERSRLLPIAAERAFDYRAVTLSSGRQSNYYVDGKQVTLGDPKGALLLAQIILKALEGQPVDTIGGLTIGADPIVGAVVALSALEGRPFPGFIVRKEPKKHGLQKDIEGKLESGARAVIVDDVITTGASILDAIGKVEAYGVDVAGVLALTDREEGGKAALEDKGYPTYAVFTAKQLAEAKGCP